jgi:hypothetical protein
MSFNFQIVQSTDNVEMHCMVENISNISLQTKD